MAFVVVGPMLAFSMAFMLLPGMLAALIAEAFAIRSLALPRDLRRAVGAGQPHTIGALDKDYDLSGEPLIAVGAGIAAGFAYWAGGRLERRLLEAGVRAGRSQPLPPPAEPPHAAAAGSIKKSPGVGPATSRQVSSVRTNQRRGCSARAAPPSSRSAKAAMVLA